MALAVPALQSPASAQSTDPLGPGGEIFPVTPTRILDTRESDMDVAPFGRKRADTDGETFSLKVTGRAGVPEDNVLAVIANVIAVGPTQPGYLSIRPAGQSATNPPTSLVNFAFGQVVPNLSFVGVDSNGEIDIELVTAFGPDSMDVVVDIYAWIATSSYVDSADDGARVVSVKPERTLDTRITGPILPPGGTINAGALNPFEAVEMPVRGVGPVPNDPDVTGVIVNLTGVFAAGNTYVSLTPDPPTPGVVAETSNGNFAPGPPRAALALVPINDDGSMYIANGPAQVDVLLDVVGYMIKGESDTTQTGRVVPLDRPFRSFDTREAEFGSVRLGDSQWEDWSFTKFSESVTIGTQSNIAQQGFFANLVAFDLQNSPLSFFTLNPREPQPFTSAPGNSTLNLPPGQVIGNTTLVRYGTDGDGDDAVVSAYNDDGSAHYHLDVYAVILD